MQDPVGSRDHVARHAHARVVDHVERDELRVRGSACIAVGAAGCDAGDEGAVPAPVAGELLGSEDRFTLAMTRLPKSCRAWCRCPSRRRRSWAACVEPVANVRPERRHLRGIGPELVVRERGSSRAPAVSSLIATMPWLVGELENLLLRSARRRRRRSRRSCRVTPSRDARPLVTASTSSADRTALVAGLTLDDDLEDCAGICRGLVCEDPERASRRQRPPTERSACRDRRGEQEQLHARAAQWRIPSRRAQAAVKFHGEPFLSRCIARGRSSVLQGPP